MNISTITIFDRYYKVFVITGLVLVTLISLATFFISKDGIILALVSLLYALVLFMIGAYNSSMARKKDSVYFSRRYQYYALRKLRAVFKEFLDKDPEYRDYTDFTLYHQKCTGRLHEKNNGYKRQVDEQIDLDGIKYTKQFLKTENVILMYHEKYLEIMKTEDHELYETYLQKVKVEIIKYQKLLENCYKRIDESIKLIERYYGDKLTYDVNYNDFFKNFYYKLINHLNLIEKSIKDIDFDYSQIYDSIVPVLEENFNDLSSSLWKEFETNNINQRQIYNMVEELLNRQDD